MKLALALIFSLLLLPTLTVAAETDRKWCGRHCGWGAGTQTPDPLKVNRCKAHPEACRRKQA